MVHHRAFIMKHNKLQWSKAAGHPFPQNHKGLVLLISPSRVCWHWLLFANKRTNFTVYLMKDHLLVRNLLATQLGERGSKM